MAFGVTVLSLPAFVVAVAFSIGGAKILQKEVEGPLLGRRLALYVCIHHPAFGMPGKSTGPHCELFFFLMVDRREGRKHAPSLLRSAYELSKNVTLGPSRHSHGQRVSWADHWHCDNGESSTNQTGSMFPAP